MSIAYAPNTRVREKDVRKTCDAGPGTSLNSLFVIDRAKWVAGEVNHFRNTRRRGERETKLVLNLIGILKAHDHATVYKCTEIQSIGLCCCALATRLHAISQVNSFRPKHKCAAEKGTKWIFRLSKCNSP